MKLSRCIAIFSHNRTVLLFPALYTYHSANCIANQIGRNVANIEITRLSEAKAVVVISMPPQELKRVVMMTLIVFNPNAILGGLERQIVQPSKLLRSPQKRTVRGTGA